MPAALLVAIQVLSFRSLPVCIYCAASSHSSRGARAIAATALLLLLLCNVTLIPGGSVQVALMVLTCLAGAALSCGAFPLMLAYTGGRIERLALALLCLAGFMGAPLLLLPPLLASVVLSLTWSMTLSAYSYCQEAGRSKQRTVEDCIFFLWVDPTLVYSQRARRVSVPRVSTRHVVRVAAGLGAIAMSAPLLEQALIFLESVDSVTRRVGAGVAAFLQLYLAHSGLASVQIGMLKMMGYDLPERYRYPFLASSPTDFWRRWNVYLGAWLRRYVFVPAVRHLRGRDSSGQHHLMRLGAAVLVTFGVAGVIHDLATSARERIITTDATAWFLAAACVSASWSAVQSWSERIDSGGGSVALLRIGVTLGGRLLLWLIVILLAGAWAGL